MSFMAKDNQTRGPFDHIVSAPAPVSGGGHMPGQYVHYYPGTQQPHAYSQQVQGATHYAPQTMLFPPLSNPAGMSTMHPGCHCPQQHMDYHEQQHYAPNTPGLAVCSHCHGCKKPKGHNSSSHKNI